MFPRGAGISRTKGPTRRPFHNSTNLKKYDSTVQNLLINQSTRVMYQGFTGRVATTNAKDSLGYGTNIVGGVTPNKSGTHLGLPLYPDVRTAAQELKPDATAVFVAAQQCGAAIEEAIAAEVPLIVAVAEHIPVHDILRVMSILKTQSKSRLVGANAPGIISPIGKCRIGFQPLPVFAPGHVGIVAKSGTLSYESVASVTRAGLGQSLCIGMGGDVVAGTSLVDALRVFEKDEQTEGMIVVGEIGGFAEEDAAEWIKEYRQRVASPKPIAALVGGVQAPWGKVMGHAGAWVGLGERTAQQKQEILQDAGVTMVDHPEKFGGVMKTLLSQAGRDVGKIQERVSSQRRGFHALGQSRSKRTPSIESLQAREERRQMMKKREEASSEEQHDEETHDKTTRAPKKRVNWSTHFQENLKPYFRRDPGPNLVTSAPPLDAFYAGVTIDRSARSPALVLSLTPKAPSPDDPIIKVPYDWQTGPTDETIRKACQRLLIFEEFPTARRQLEDILRRFASAHKRLEAINLGANCSIVDQRTNFVQSEALRARHPFAPESSLNIHTDPLLQHYDPSATHRQQHLQNNPLFSYLTSPPLLPNFRILRKGNHRADDTALEAAQHGIVYHRLAAHDARIATLVNGAGLALNTLDALNTTYQRKTFPAHQQPTDQEDQRDTPILSQTPISDSAKDVPTKNICTNFLDTGGKATSATIATSFALILRDARVRVIFVNIFGGLTDGGMIAEGVLEAFKTQGEVMRERGIPVVVRIRGTNEAEGQRVIRESGLGLESFDGFAEAAERVVELAGLPEVVPGEANDGVGREG